MRQPAVRLRQPDTRPEAFGLIRGLIDAVILTPIGGKLEIELRGDLAGILAMSDAGKASSSSLGSQLHRRCLSARGFASTKTFISDIAFLRALCKDVSL